MIDRPVLVTGAGVVASDDAVLDDVREDWVLRGVDDASVKVHVGRRGIRYKDLATRLALAAGRRAMSVAGLVDDFVDFDDPRAAVVVGSCFGNADTVVRCAETIENAGSAALSPMDLPNASANVVAATLAIWFGFRGPNLMLANDRETGFDALMFACNLIRVRRVERALVCGVEVDHLVLRRLFAADGRASECPKTVAAAVVLEAAGSRETHAGSWRIATLGRPSPRRVILQRTPECRHVGRTSLEAFSSTWAAAGLLAVIREMSLDASHGSSCAQASGLG